MDMDELKEKWAEHDRKLEASLRLNRQLLTATTLDRARSALQRLAVSLAFEVVMQLAAVVMLGSYLFEHIGITRFAVPAAALDVFAIVILNSLIRQVIAARQIDYGKPIATIQKQIEALRMLRLRYTQWVLLLSPLAWTPLLIVALEGLFGVDAYDAFGAAFLSANLLVGVAVIPLAIWLSRRFGDRMGRSPAIQRLMRDITGHNLNAAAGFLATLSEFEDEASDS